MKTLNFIFYFPNNWYQYGSVKIRNNGKKIGKIKYAEETIIEVSPEIKEVSLSVNFYKKSLEIDKLQKDKYFGVVYFKVNNFLDTLKPKILRVKIFETKLERQEFCNNLYTNFGNSTPVKNKNQSNLILGLLISMILFLMPFYPNQTSIIREIGSQNVSLPIILGIGGFISYLLIFINKTISLSSYKSRIYTTIAGFGLSLFYINSKTFLIILSMLTFALLIRSYYEFKKLHSNNI